MILAGNKKRRNTGLFHVHEAMRELFGRRIHTQRLSLQCVMGALELYVCLLGPLDELPPVSSSKKGGRKSACLDQTLKMRATCYQFAIAYTYCSDPFCSTVSGPTTSMPPPCMLLHKLQHSKARHLPCRGATGAQKTHSRRIGAPQNAHKRFDSSILSPAHRRWRDFKSPLKAGEVSPADTSPCRRHRSQRGSETPWTGGWAMAFGLVVGVKQALYWVRKGPCARTCCERRGFQPYPIQG